MVDEIAQAIIDEPAKAGDYLTKVPNVLFRDFQNAGATDAEAYREVGKYRQAINAELARRRHGERQGPGVA